MTVRSDGKLLHLEDVYKLYGSKMVLDDIDFSVRAGEFCVIVGPSGCGKSTLLRLILGEENATSGNILLEGHPIGHPNTDRGVVYQKYSLFPNLTVANNVLLGKKLGAGLIGQYRKHQELREEALWYLERVRLAEHADKYPHELSGGMQQRVAIVQSLIMRPKILLMDEPFGALDPATREEMQLFILELWEAFNMTVFFVTHDLEEGLFLGTRIVVLSQYYRDGRDQEDDAKSDGQEVSRGAKIVSDYMLERKAFSTVVKRSAEMAQLIEQIRNEGFNPQYRQHVTEFNLRHPDSFRTINEWRTKSG